MRKRFPVATNKFIEDQPGLYVRLLPEEFKGERLEKGILRLCDRHYNEKGASAPRVHGNVDDLEMDRGGIYWADIDIPEVRSTADYREDVEAKLKGKSFSIGVQCEDLRPVKRGINGEMYADAIGWDAIDVIDTPFPKDIGASRSFSYEGQDYTYNLQIKHLKEIDMIRLNRDLDSAEDLSELEENRGEYSDEEDDDIERNEADDDDMSRNEHDDMEGRSMSRRMAALERELSTMRKNDRERRKQERVDKDHAAMRRLAVSRDLGEDHANAAIKEGMSRVDYAEKLASLAIQPQETPSIKRSGLRGFSLGGYMEAMEYQITGKGTDVTRQFAIEREVHDMLKDSLPPFPSNLAHPNGIALPFQVMALSDMVKRGPRDEVSRAILTQDNFSAIETLVDQMSSQQFLYDAVPFLEALAMQTGLTDQWQTFHGDSTNPPQVYDTATEDAEITESEVNVTGPILLPRTLATLYKLPTELIVTNSVGLTEFFQTAYANFLRQRLAKAVIDEGLTDRTVANTPESKKFEGAWDLLEAAHTANASAKILQSFGTGTSVSRANIVERETQLQINQGMGGRLNWILSSQMAGLLRSTTQDGSDSFPIYIANMDGDWQTGQAGKVLSIPYYQTNQLPDKEGGSNTGDRKYRGIYGYTEAIKVGIWGPGIEVVVFRPAMNTHIQYSYRMYANSTIVQALNLVGIYGIDAGG